MKKLIALCTLGMFVAGAAVCVAADPAPAPAPAAAPAPAPETRPNVSTPAPRTPAAAPVVKPPAPVRANKAGVVVPAWEATAVDGGAVFSGDKLKGKTYGIVFVNSSCSACRGEISALMNLEFKGDFTLLVAAVDARLDRTVKTYKEDLLVTYPILDDSKFALAKVFGIGFTPASVIVDKDGKVEFWGAGYTADSSEEILAAFLKYGSKK